MGSLTKLSQNLQHFPELYRYKVTGTKKKSSVGYIYQKWLVDALLIMLLNSRSVMGWLRQYKTIIIVLQIICIHSGLSWVIHKFLFY